MFNPPLLTEFALKHYPFSSTIGAIGTILPHHLFGSMKAVEIYHVRGGPG